MSLLNTLIRLTTNCQLCAYNVVNGERLFLSSTSKYIQKVRFCRQYKLVNTMPPPTHINCENFLSISFRKLSATNVLNRHDVCDKKDYANAKNGKQKVINTVLEKKERFKESGQFILKDIRETKNKMKEKMEEVIERENVLTIPNFLCVSRIIISPYLGYVITQSNFQLAFGLFVFAGVTDLIDGWIARTYPTQATKIGSFLDPMADKVLVAILFITLTYIELIPIPLTAMIIARDLLLVIAGFYIRYQSLPPPKTLSRYFDVTHATAQLAPTLISKVNTAVQLTLIATTLAAPVFNFVDEQIIHTLWYITAATTVASAFSYIFSRNTYKYLKPKK